MTKSNESRLNALIEALGMKQIDFAKKLSINPAHLSRLCNGLRPLSKGMISQIVAGTGCSKEWLESGTGEMFPISQESAFAQARAAGASPFIAAAVQRYCELPPGDVLTNSNDCRKSRIGEGIVFPFLTSTPASILGVGVFLLCSNQRPAASPVATPRRCIDQKKYRKNTPIVNNFFSTC